jgi:hypothetical protein
MEHGFDTGLDDGLLDLSLNEKLNKKRHISEALHALTMLNLTSVINKQHLLVEVFLH